jgi:NAD(P)H-dependent flavin oxidoreductase YrpB (nitropropane dioxygenase family)
VLDIRKLSNELEYKYNKKIPVIAAGGIYSGSDMFRIIKMGASAVQLGTRFIATEECDASAAFKNNFIQSHEEDIQIIKSPVGMPGRAIFNQFLRDSQDGKKRPATCKYNCIKSCDSKTTLYCIADALVAACEGNMDSGFAFSGSNAGKVKEITTVRHIFTEMIHDYFIAKKADK